MATYRKVYRFRMEPSKAQESKLNMLAGSRRFVFNWALARRREHYAKTGKTLGYSAQASELKALKNYSETAWLKESDSQLLQQALKDVERAFVNFFEKRAKYPRFKSKKKDPLRFRIPQRVRVEGSQVYVPKVGWLKVRKSQEVEGETKSATFKQEVDGHWYVSLVSQFEMPEVPLPPANPERVVGIDLGLKDFYVLSDGKRKETPKFARRAQRKLRRAARRHSKCTSGSKRKAKAKRKLAGVHRKIANQRKDFVHQNTSDLVRQYQGFCIENLCIKGMAKTKLSKSVLDAALGEFRRQLTYKAQWHRKWLVVINRWFPSSKLCGECGSIHANLRLKDREWVCGCGAVHDRDLNAARNIKAEGLSQIVAVGHTETLNARGEDVRPATAGYPC